jgi:predicted metal-dependent hydrolase
MHAADSSAGQPSRRIFPPYSYVTGRFPHPIRDPAGHSYGAAPPKVEPILPSEWQRSDEYHWACELFNHGYYWEAHEAWESLWHAAGRSGPTGEFLQGLVKLAAAGVKVREGRAAGVRSHAARARELFTGVRAQVKVPRFLGMDLGWLIEQAAAIQEVPPESVARGAPVESVFGLKLRPSD